uniref:Fatty-acid and retinol-binding protein 1 n=1 Tax=Strongyloides stercoralis TaxID=6248 RepID=A0AAF5D4H6_STRER
MFIIITLSYSKPNSLQNVISRVTVFLTNDIKILTNDLKQDDKKIFNETIHLKQEGDMLDVLEKNLPIYGKHLKRLDTKYNLKFNLLSNESQNFEYKWQLEAQNYNKFKIKTINNYKNFFKNNTKNIENFCQLKGNVITYDRIPNDQKKYVAHDIRKYYDELNNEERVILYEIVMTHNGNDEEAVKIINKKSPSLGVKTDKFYEKFNEKINLLSNETRTFLKHIRYEAGLLIPHNKESLNEEKINEFIKYFVNEYNKLSLKEKEELQKDFPALDIIAKKQNLEDVINVFKNEKRTFV